MNTPLRAAALPFLALLACLPAQEPGTDAGNSSALPAVVPIHTGPDDPAGHGPYGYWASGPSWKASFHGGFAFYPYIPDAATTRGFRWHTESIVVGGQELALGEPTMVTAERRCEYRFGGVTEAYDVREQGVEQTFVFDRLPAARGELVVTGRVTTSFHAPATERPRHGALAFRDETGAVVMTYGEAKVFDAAGRSTRVETSFDGQRLSLVVDAAWMGEAQLPITVDPLVSASETASVPASGTAVACATEPGEGEAIFTLRRRFSATDEDATAWRYTERPGGLSSTFGWTGFPPMWGPLPNMPTLVFADQTTTNSIAALDVADVEGTAMFVYAIQRDYTGFPTLTSTLSQPWSSTVVNAGTIHLLPVGRFDPRIGGSRGVGTQALIVSTELLVSGTRRVRGNVLNTSFGVLSSSFDLHSFASSADSFAPAVTDAAEDFGNWGVAWIAAYGNPAGNEVRIAEITQLGSPTTTRVLTVDPAAREPRLAGAGGRYLATWVHTPPGTNGVLSSARYDIRADSTLLLIQERVVATASGFLQTLTNGDVAFDHATRSHWASTYATRTNLITSIATAAYCTRHGYTGAPLSIHALTSSSTIGVANPGVSFFGRDFETPLTFIHGFLTSFSTQEPGNPLYYRSIEHGDATSTSLGSSCRSNFDTQNHLPWAGSEFYARTVQGLPASTAAILLVGLTPVNVPLDFVGMTGCTLLVDFAWTFGAAATPAGDATVTIALPDDPIFQGLLRVQWLWLDGTAPTGLVTGRGTTLEVK